MSLSIPIISEFSDKGIKRAIAEFKQLKTTGEKAQFALKKAALPAILALGALAGMASKTIAAGEAAATANARIEQINESMGLFGDATDKVNKRLIEYANVTARATGIDQNQIKLAQAKLLTFKELAMSADEAGGAFDRATQAAIDMGAAGFGDAATNAVQLGKALNDPIKGVTALAKSGVTFTEQEKEKIKVLVQSGKLLEAQEMVLKAIEIQVGGTAEATANDSDKMKVAFSQLSESVGIILLPVFKDLTAVLMKVADFARENSRVIVILAGGIGALAVTVIAVNAAMKVYKATLVIITAAQALFNFVMSANPIGLAIIAIAAIVAALVILEKKFGFVTAALRIVGDGFRNGIIDPVRAAIGLIADLVRAIGKIPGVGAIGGLIGKIDIPGFANGGIVTGPTLAMVGEKGPEAIVPLNKAGGFGGVTINVNGGISTSAQIGQAVYNSLLNYKQVYGPLNALAS
jgi:hypothetical protein